MNRHEDEKIRRGETGDEKIQHDRGEQPEEINEENDYHQKESDNPSLADIDKNDDYDPSEDASRESNPDDVNEQATENDENEK